MFPDLDQEVQKHTDPDPQHCIPISTFIRGIIFRPDLRNPGDIGPDFLRAYWTRKVHPELYSLQAEGLSLRIEQLGGALAPLEVVLTAASLEAAYSEATEDAAQFTFLQARRSEHRCLSRIRIFSPPGSEFFLSRIQHFKRKNCFISSRKYDPSCSCPGSRILIFYPSRIQGSKRHRIPDPDPQYGRVSKFSLNP
jgi:hypothetical protein